MNRKKEIAGVGLLGNTAKGDDEIMKQMKTIGDVSKCAARHLPCPFLTLSNPHARRYIVAFNVQMVTNIDSQFIDFAKKILYARTDTNKTELNKMFADPRLQNLLPKTMTITMPAPYASSSACASMETSVESMMIAPSTTEMPEAKLRKSATSGLRPPSSVSTT
eukprot:6644503-Prymnesium_polylepis.1